MIPFRLLFAIGVAAGLALFVGAGCSLSGLSTGGTNGDDASTSNCGASVCGCRDPGVETCTANGVTCTCIPNASAYDAGPDSALPPDFAVFVGDWSPYSGTGQEECPGQTVNAPPDTSTVFTFTQDGPYTMSAVSSAVNCKLELAVSGETASLATPPYTPYETCTDSTGTVYFYEEFNLTYVPAPSDDAGTGDASDASSDASDDATSDGGVDDASTEDAEAGAPRVDTLQWDFVSGYGNCATTLHYTLVRVK